MTIRLHGLALSGHSHRIELFLRILGLEHEYRETGAQARQSPEFLALNPLGQVPVLEDGDLVLPDSNAILVYLAKRYDRSGAWLPEDPAAAAAVQRWLSIAAGEVRYGPGLARVATLFKRPDEVPSAQAVAQRLLPFMDRHLADRDWLAAERPTIADLACYSYVAHAPEGGIDLTPYAAIRAWLSRVEALPAFKPMPRTPVPA